VAILAGGLATRLLPVTEQVPKCLVDVAGRPFAEHQLLLLREHGLREIVFLVGHLGEMVRDRLGDGGRFGVRVRYAFDGPRRLGTGGAIRQALAELGPRFFVLYGDSYLECDYAAVERSFRQSGRRALMTVCRNDGRWDRSNVEFADGRIVRYDKSAADAAMRHIDYGLGAFTAQAFEGWRAGESVDLADVYRSALADADLAAFEVAGRFYEIGSPGGLAETTRYLATKEGQAR
jgi:NDP-sugar pyrophosphorylase family protein